MMSIYISATGMIVTGAIALIAPNFLTLISFGWCAALLYAAIITWMQTK